MKRTSSFMKKRVMLFTATLMLLMFSTLFGYKAGINAELSLGPQKVTEENADELDFIVSETNPYVTETDAEHNIYEVKDSSVEFDDRDSLSSDYDMVEGRVYRVTYPDALVLGDGVTKLTVRVDAKLLPASEGDHRYPGTPSYSKILVYQGSDEPQYKNKVRVYWRNAQDMKVEWTISLFKDSDCVYPNTTSVLTGFVDPDESDYRFNTTIRNAIYYKEANDYSTKGSIMDPNTGYSFVDSANGGFIRNGATLGTSPSGFDQALFLVDIADTFTFTTRTYHNGTLIVPFFYAPCYSVVYHDNSPTGSHTGNVDNQVNNYGVGNKIADNGYAVEGYKFVGWNTVTNPTESTPGISFNEKDPYIVSNVSDPNNTFNQSVPAGSKVDIYAQWVPTYKVVYNANSPTGSYTGNVDPQVNEFEKENNISDNGFAVEGYKFVGWNILADPTDDNPGIKINEKDPYSVKQNDPEKDNLFKATVDANGIIDIYAQWVPTYKVVYNANSPTGSYTGNVDPQVNEFEKENNISDNGFAVEGYKFVGWNILADPTDDNPGIKINEKDPYSVKQNDPEKDNLFKATVDANGIIDVYAQWVTYYTVKYDANRPDGTTGSGSMPDVKDYFTEKDTVKKNLYTTDGYTFVGWNTKEDGTGEKISELAEYTVLENNPENLFKESVPAKGEVTLYAQWERTPYKIHYDANGGKGLMNTQVFYYTDEKMVSRENAFTRDGYRFIGFQYNGKDGTKAIYKTINDFRSILIDKITGPEITLVAQWEKIEKASTEVYYIPVTGIE